MKHYISLLLASVIIGAVVFCIFYFIVGMNKVNATSVAISSAFAGFVGECIRPWLNSISQKKKKGTT